ncbi:ankyrin repeat domain-containing protein 22 isoform X4 [Siniperca chuatsi]|uniref:ankyrin repeat domain-containing protein 22 isoform X4 n=1 Tax=Siniperca chuatsi TaxID=119488 RepID=UPI001CE17654|nr:ankyrin repeat domain-containing protein 22 isoform X4 [Siniperca chuatsi]
MSPGEFLPANMGLVYSEPACQSAYDGDVDQLFRLLRKDPNRLNVQEERTGDTPLIAACRHGNLRVVRYLLDNGADVHLTNKQRTCLHYVSKRSLSLLDYLMIAILMPILLLGYFLMKGNTALHYVCQRESHRLVPLLLERNADTDIQNNDKETPLDIATRLKFKKIVNILRKTR